MLSSSTFRKHRPVIVLLTVFGVLVISWSLLPYKPWTGRPPKIMHTFSCPGQTTAHVPSLPPEYSQTVPKLTDCLERLGLPFLQGASNTSVNYCSDTSSSTLTCFRTHASSERVDSFCIGTPGVFDREDKKFRLGCVLSNLTEQQVVAGIPALAQFPYYWYETGPRLILDRHITLDPVATVRSEHVGLPKNYTILVRREEPIDNLFHHFMQIFSIFLTLDILQLVLDPVTGKPFFCPEDVENTRVVIFDDHDEGPFYHHWTALARRPLQRIQDLCFDATPAPENIILPLPGAANPFWQGDWVPHHCEESKLLQVFSRRMLTFYGINDEPGPLDGPLVLTFIDRKEKRSLVDKKPYIDDLKFSYPDVEINLVNFASLPFTEQLRTIRKTDILAGVHGAGLTHGIFLRPSSTMVEIMPPKFNHKGFRNLAKASGHRYFTTHAIEHDNYTTSKGWQIDDVFIEQDRFNDLMGTAIKSMYHGGLRDDDVN